MPIEKSEKFFKKKSRKSFVVQKIALPLYSLSASNAEMQRRLSKMILENIPYRQAVQRVALHYCREIDLK